MIKIDKNTGKSFVKILKIMSALRDPKTGCEWDKDQDSNSIKSYCIEEAYEVVEAIENNDNDALCEELGDLFFTIINLSRRLNLDPEQTIRKANKKFTTRFNEMENFIEDNKLKWHNLNKHDFKNLWNKLKNNQRGINE